MVLSSLSRFGCWRPATVPPIEKKDAVVCLCTVHVSMRRVPIEQEVCAGQGGESANSEREEGLRTPQPLNHTVRARCIYNRTCKLHCAISHSRKGSARRLARRPFFCRFFTGQDCLFFPKVQKEGKPQISRNTILAIRVFLRIFSNYGTMLFPNNIAFPACRISKSLKKKLSRNFLSNKLFPGHS